MNYPGANGRARPPGAPKGSASRPYHHRETDEFASGASEWPDDLSRREFLRLAGATLALAGLSSCTKQPLERIVPASLRLCNPLMAWTKHSGFANTSLPCRIHRHKDNDCQRDI